MQNLPNIVQARLQRPIPATESHPDADLLTAFAEQSLASHERSDLLQHLAHCGDCRDVVALALPATEAAGAMSLAANARIGWLSLPVLRWSVAAAAILFLTSAGVLQYKQRHQEKTLLSSNLVPQDQMPHVAMQSPVPIPQASASPAIAPSTEIGKQTATQKKTSSSAQRAFPADKPVPPANAIFPHSQPMRRATPEVAFGDAAGASSAGQGPAAAQVDSQPGTEPEQSSADQLEAVAKAKPALAQPPASGLAPAPLLHIDPSLLKSPAAPRWIINASGALQRSLDAGKTWLDVNVAADQSTGANPPAPTIFHALLVSSNAAEVWAGGSSGTLYHTLDGGSRWARVLPSDSGLLLAGDIISIQFSNPQNGTVTTSNSEVWTTIDDGQTWHKQQ